MKVFLCSLLVIAGVTLAASAEANTTQGQPGNCAIYAALTADTIEADGRITGTAEAEAVETLRKFSTYLDGIVEAEMEQTYAASAAFGWDKATVDAKMKAGEAAIRDGFVGYGMEPDTLYADHLSAVLECTKNMARQGKLGEADVAKMSARMNAVYSLIR